MNTELSPFASANNALLDGLKQATEAMRAVADEKTTEAMQELTREAVAAQERWRTVCVAFGTLLTDTLEQMQTASRELGEVMTALLTATPAPVQPPADTPIVVEKPAPEPRPEDEYDLGGEARRWTQAEKERYAEAGVCLDGREPAVATAATEKEDEPPHRGNGRGRKGRGR